MKRPILIALCLLPAIAFSQSINKNWKQDLHKELSLIQNCQNSASNGVNPCNKYMVSPLTTIYNINDFYSKELGRHMLVNEITSFLEKSNKWTLLGRGYEQDALVEAQNYANTNKAVIAVYTNDEGLGHISVIIPGELKKSGTWGFEVPNSASFFPSDPEKSYVDKALSYSFERTQIKKVLIYGRNY